MRREPVRGRNGALDAIHVSRAQVGVRYTLAVGERPAVEAPALDPVELAGREVVTEQIATVVGREELSAAWAPVEAHRVAKSRGIELGLAAVGLVAENGRAPGVALLARVAARSDGDVEQAVGADADGARPVVSAGRKPGHDPLVLSVDAARGGVEADAADRVHLRNVEPALVELHAVGAGSSRRSGHASRPRDRRRLRRARATRRDRRGADSRASPPSM